MSNPEGVEPNSDHSFSQAAELASFTRPAEGQATPEHQLGRTLRERHPGWPEAELQFYFTGHETPENLTGHDGIPEDRAHLPELIKDADVYCFEYAGDDKNRENLKAYLQGAADKPPTEDPAEIEAYIEKEGLGGTFVEGQVRALYGSGVIVGHFDIRPSDGITGEEIDAAFTNSPEPASFEEALQVPIDKARRVNELQDRRDDIQLGPGVFPPGVPVQAGRFEEELARIFKEHPELRDRKRESGETVRVVATEGDMHSDLYHRARAAGVNVKRLFPEKHHTYSYSNELRRRLRYNQEVSQDFLAKCYAESVTEELIIKAGDPQLKPVSPEFTTYVRSVAQHFSVTDAEALYNAYNRSQSYPENWRAAWSVVDDNLTKHYASPLSWTQQGIQQELAEQRKVEERMRKAAQKKSGDRRSTN
ncbi:MAG TPA: hypothetical protein VJ836_02210 [Candidatus Saccharimonadales bacterium]|nr:hypothetical protein [Candidatus Saccharimonadales bacterium]